MEPENLSLKPADLQRTGKYPSKSPPVADIMISTPTTSPPPKKVCPIRIPSAYPNLPYYAQSRKPEEAPLNLSPATSPNADPIALANPINWHKPLQPNLHPSYLAFTGYHLPTYSTEAFSLYSPRSDQVSPFVRDSSISPPYRSDSPQFERNRNNNVIKSEHYSYRYMPYHIGNHHGHHIDQSSLSPTSTASFNSYLSSRRSMSPVSNTSSGEDLTPALSVLMEKSNSSSNIQPKHFKKETEKPGQHRYQCPACNKSYSTYSGLSKHQQFHCAASEGNQSKKTFVCKFCPKTYASLGALKMHIRTHTLPCKCHLCGKAFSRPWLLQGHIRTHTGEKPFSCQHCHRAFADRSNLRAHLQTHSDVKKYSCQTCSKTFSRMSLLTKHTEGGCPGLQQGPSPPSTYSPSLKQELQCY